MAEPTEDVPYSVSEHATPEPEQQDDADQPNKSVLIEVRKYLDKSIDTHNSFDAILPEAEKTMTTQQQVQMHKQIVIHLRNIRSTVDDKIKELK